METDLFTIKPKTLVNGERLNRVFEHSKPWSTEAQEVALKIAARDGRVDSDKLQDELPREYYINPCAVGAVFGSLVKAKKLKKVDFKQSERESRNGATIFIYELVN